MLVSCFNFLTYVVTLISMQQIQFWMTPHHGEGHKYALYACSETYNCAPVDTESFMNSCKAIEGN